MPPAARTPSSASIADRSTWPPRSRNPASPSIGPTDPARNGPYGGTIRVLRSPDAATDYSRRATPHASMFAITPRMVADALAAALEASSAGCRA